MDGPYSMEVVAHIRSPFSTKFGVPRQSGLAPSLESLVVFEPPYRNPDALRGLEEFSHIWLIWVFSQAARAGWSPTVRPPRLGGNARLGVFATRSPFRPNPIALSAVKLEGVERRPDLGPVLRVSGADLMDGTPILDIKPYLPYADALEATGGFTDACPRPTLAVDIPSPWREVVPPPLLAPLTEVLAQDPRPSYQHDPQRVYGFVFAGLEVGFRVEDGVLTVCRVEPEQTK